MQIGRYVSQPTGYKAFIPEKFPPVEFISLPPKTENLHAKAAFFVGVSPQHLTRILFSDSAHTWLDF